MGTKGPIPKRNGERLSHDKVARQRQEAPSATAAPVSAPPENPHWHALAKAWYRALRHSGMAQFYEPSDWVQAALGADVISNELKGKFVGLDRATGDPIYATAPMDPQALAGILKMSAVLGVTEGDRRRMGVELTRKEHEAEEEAQILHLVKDEENEAFG